MRPVDYKLLLLSLCVLHLCVRAAGRPLRKRTVSEVQLMHDLGEHQQVQERRAWLQMSLRGIHTAAGAGLQEGEAAGGRRMRRLRPEDLLTSDQIQHALSLLEKLLEDKQSRSGSSAETNPTAEFMLD